MPAYFDPNPEPQGTPLPAEWLDFVQAGSAALGASVEELSDAELALRMSVLDAGEDSSVSSEPKALAGRLDALRRASAQVRALTLLGDRAAPAELEGLVVASLHCGARQDRAVRQVEALAPPSAPRSLDEAVARMVIGEGRGSSENQAPLSLRVPSVLDRLVEESLADPAKANSKSMTARLGRQGAPSELTKRVESELQIGDRKAESSEEAIGARSVAAALVSMGLAVALVVTVGLRGNRQTAELSAGPTTDATTGSASGPATGSDEGAPAEIVAAGDASDRVAHVRLEVIMLDEDGLSDDDRKMLRLLGGAL